MPRTPYALADLMGEPRPIVLAGDVYAIAPMRVRDLGTLGAFAMRPGPDDAPDPIELAAMLPPDADKAARASAFKAAQDWAMRPPPDVGSDAYRDAFRGAEGVAWLAYVALRRHNEPFGVDDAIRLVARIAAEDPGGFARLSSRAYGTHPIQRFLGLVNPAGGDPPDWPARIDRVATAKHIPYDAVYEMTLPAFFSALRDGKAVEVEYKPRPGEGVISLMRRTRSLLGLD